MERTLTIEIDANTVKAIKSINATAKSLKSIKTAAKTATDGVKKLDNTIKAIVGAVGSIYIVSKAFNVLKSSANSFISTASQFEQFNAVLTTLEGYRQKAAADMKWITDFTAKTPYQLDQVTEAFVKLKSYGLEPTKGLLKTLGDTASAMNKPVMQAVEAIVDAVTGENERLKEFGIKASLQGDKVAYTLQTASGQTKSIIVKNNKEIIQSTLEAIFNSKYAGAMQMQSQTLKGIISNIQDQWTLFKNSVMSAGLFNYIKAVTATFATEWSKALNGAKSTAISWSKTIIDGIKTSIGAIGFLKDFVVGLSLGWNAVKATFALFVIALGKGMDYIARAVKGTWTFIEESGLALWAGLKIAFWGVPLAIGKGINAIYKGWQKFLANMNNAFKATIDFIGKGFYDFVNYLLKGIEKYINKLSSSLGSALTAVGLKNPFKKVSLSIGEYVSSIKTAKEESKDLIDLSYLQEQLNSATKEVGNFKSKVTEAFSTQIVKTPWSDNLFKNSVANINKDLDTLMYHSGQKSANEFLQGVDKKFAEYQKGNINSVDKSIYDKELDKMGAKLGALGDSATKAGKKATKAHKDASKAAKEHEKELEKLAKEAEKVKESYKNLFTEGIGSILKGDFTGGFSSIFKNLTDKLITPLQDSISSYLGNITQSLFSNISPTFGGLLGFGLNAISSLFSSKLSQAEIDAATGRSEFDSEYFSKSVELWTKYAQEGNYIANQQLNILKSMDSSLQSFGRGLASSADGFRLDGADMTSSESNVLFGLFSSKSTPLGSGIEIATQSVEQLTTAIETLGYQSYKVESSGLFGLFSSESIDTNYRELSDSMTKALQDVVNKTLDSTAANLKTLGFDGEKFRQEIEKQVVAMGKINFKDITDPQQQMQVLQNAISEMLSGATENVLKTFSDPQMFASLEQWQQAGEDLLTTIGRVAVGFDQVGVYFDFFGQKLTDFNQSEELIKAAGGLDALTSGLNTFIHNFFSSSEQKQFLQMQLQNALAVYNVALPASKEQFKALVLETQAKIANTKAQIETLKAEIAAKVKAGEISLAVAYGEVKGKADAANKYAYVANQWGKSSAYMINSANNAGQAVVGFGNNLHRTVEGIATGTANAVRVGVENAVNGAGKIDYSRITSPAIQALEAQLANLEGLYGTFMSQMSGFANYYNDAGSSISSAGNAASDASSKFDDLTKSLISIAQLKADWGDDPMEGAKLVLEATKKVTGLTNLTYENFLDKFKELTKDGKGLKDSVLSDWQSMSSALKKVHDIQYSAFEKFISNLKDLANETNNIANGLIDSSTSATLEFTQERYAQQAREFESYFSNGVLRNDVDLQDVLDSYKELNSLASTLSKNAYNDTKDKLFNSLMLQEDKLLSLDKIKMDDPRLREQQKTNDKLDDVVKELQEIKKENQRLRAEYERLRRESA